MTTREDPCASQISLILGHFCLAYQGSFCSVCIERSPANGAITIVQGKPRVNPDFCTGCKICHEVCPAPKNAVFLVSRKPRQGMVPSINASSVSTDTAPDARCSGNLTFDSEDSFYKKNRIFALDLSTNPAVIDAVESPNGGWVGLSEIVATGNDGVDDSSGETQLIKLGNPAGH